MIKGKFNYILGLDLGSQSIGWSVCECDEEHQVTGLSDLGVRIFDDGRDAKSKEPLAVGRRLAKQTARRRKRAYQRRQALLKCLREHDLLPSDKAESRSLSGKDPYLLRARAVEKKIARHEIGRALLHINKRRGFKSNRKDAQSSDKELTGMKKGIEVLGGQLGDSQTIGQYLLQKKEKAPHKSIRFRPQQIGSSNEWEVYPERAMYADEIKAIFETQRTHHPDLNDQLLERIMRIIIEQRPLKRPKVGSCRFYTCDRRVPLALPSQQKFRILQEVSNLEIRENEKIRSLSEEERAAIVEQLSLKAKKSHLGKKGTELSFAKIKSKILGDSCLHFNLEEMGRKGLNSDLTSLALSSGECFGVRWFDLNLDEQDLIVLKLTGNEDKEIQDEDDQVVAFLIERYSLTVSQAESCLHANLPDGYGRLGQRAIRKLLPQLETGMFYSAAVVAAGLEDPLSTVKLREKLPYYGEILENYTMPHPADGRPEMQDLPEVRFGRIPNPTVHIGLNQVRKVVNALTDRYGLPQVIRVELARDFAFSADQQSELKRNQAKNRKRNEDARDAIAEAGQEPRSHENLLRYKLWTELNQDCLKRCCPFSGRVIGIEQLFSSEIEVEHILPFSKTFDDSFNNKTLCFRDYNRLKLNKTPFEAFGSSPMFPGIIERTSRLNPGKSWRFREGAMERFIRDENPDLIARTLNDTRYLSRAAVAYLSAICPKVQTIRGAMTAALRHFWGLDRVLSEANVKDRSEHRHHAIDAFVVAASTPSFLNKFQKLTEASKLAHPERNPLHLPDFPPPYDGYKVAGVAELAAGVLVSHRQNQIKPTGRISKSNVTPGPLHEQTYYGLETETDKDLILKVRKPLLDLKPGDCSKIASPRLQGFFMQKATEITNPADWKAFLESILKSGRIRRLRMLEQKSKKTVTSFRARDGKVYRYAATGGNAWADIIAYKDNQGREKWESHVVSLFSAATDQNEQPAWKQARPAARKIARLSINDVVALKGCDETWRLYRVKKIRQDGRVYVRDLRIAQEDKDSLSLALRAYKMQEYSLTKVALGPAGDLRAPKHILNHLYVGPIYSHPE